MLMRFMNHWALNRWRTGSAASVAIDVGRGEDARAAAEAIAV